MTNGFVTDRVSVAYAPAMAWRRRQSGIEKWGLFLAVSCAGVSAVGMVAGFIPALAALTALGFAMAIYGLNKPGIGLMGISMLCTLDPLSRALLFAHGPFPWNTFNYWLLLVLLLSIGFLLKLNDLQSRLMQLFTVLLLYGLLFTPSLEVGVEAILNTIAYFGLLVYFYRNNRSDEGWYWQGVVSGVLGAAGGFVYYIQQNRLPYVNENAWAYFPVTAIFAICLGFRYAPQRGKGQLYLGLLAILNLTWIFLSGSRGTLITGLICMVFLIASMRSKVQRLGYIVIGATIVSAVIILFGARNEYAMKRIDKMLNPSESMVGRTSGRSDLALGGWYIFLENPFGVGTGGFSSAWSKMGYRETLSGFSYGQNKEAHSGWIKILAENGFLGFLVLGVFVVSFGYAGWQKRRKELFRLGGFITILLSLAWVSTEFASKGLWFLIAGATALLHMKSDTVSYATRAEGPLSKTTKTGRL